MDTALVLIRHGLTDWNLAGRLQGRTDIPLNDTGRGQARGAGRELVGQDFSLILASPLGRAQETAALIAEELNAETGQPVPDLIERGFGPLEGRIMAEVSDEESVSLQSQLEPIDDILRRAIPALIDLSVEHAGKKVAVVSHGATMRAIRDALAGTKLPRGVENGEIIQINIQRLNELAEELDLVSC